MLIPEMVLPVYSGDCAIRVLRLVRFARLARMLHVLGVTGIALEC
jgi:hypothetical protein